MSWIAHHKNRHIPLLVPMATAFLASTCFMMTEIVAGRLVAKQFGTSIYTWTSVIGVCLAGMSLGNYVGGRLADRFRAKSLIATLLLAAAAGCVFIPAANNLLAHSFWLYRFPWSQQIAAHVAAVFFLPTLLMSTVSPVATKMALDAGLGRGRTVGSVYAVSTLGAITGTFLAGFVVVAALGSQATIWVIAAILVLAALPFAPKAPTPYLAFTVLAALAFCALSPQPWAQTLGAQLALRKPTNPNVIYEDESQYSYIAVGKQGHQSDQNLRYLRLDQLQHSLRVTNRPLQLEYGYERVFASIVRRFKPDDVFNALLIGGGGYSLPHYLRLIYPQAQLTVVEIDPKVTQAAFEAFGLPRNIDLDIHHMDGRNYVETLLRDQPVGKNQPPFDFILADAVNSYSAPFHLTTLQFTQKIKQLLSPQGLYLMTVIDLFREGQFLGALINTFNLCFDHVYVFGGRVNAATDQAPRETFTLIGSDRPLDLKDIGFGPRSAKSLPDLQLTDDEIAKLAQRSGGLVLTDDYAPVENLLSRVAETSAPPIDRILLAKAIDLTQTGQYSAAIRTYREALDANPECFTCLINLGILLEQTGKSQEAFRHFSQAKSLDPDNPIPVFNLAGLLSIQGLFDQAIERYHRAIDLKPDYVEAHNRLGNIYFRRDEHAKAVEHYRQSLKHRPDDPVILNNLGATLVQLDKPQDALPMFQKAIQIKPDYTRCHINLGDLHKAQGRFDDARSEYQKALKIEPANPDIRKRLQQLPSK